MEELPPFLSFTEYYVTILELFGCYHWSDVSEVQRLVPPPEVCSALSATVRRRGWEPPEGGCCALRSLPALPRRPAPQDQTPRFYRNAWWSPLADMARGHQKFQSQQKNAKKQAEQKKKQGHDQKAAAKVALVYSCAICRVTHSTF
ncbi:zinc finger protein 706 isoform X2 [Lissotriton helveticus]